MLTKYFKGNSQKKKKTNKMFSSLQILLTCNALFASFMSSIFSFDLKNKIMLFQTSILSDVA